MKTRGTALVSATIACAMLGACAGTLPEPVYGNQVEAYFPEPEETAPDAEPQRAVHAEAGHCAARLNGHRSTTESVSTIQAIISGIGGATGGVGGALAVVNFGNPDINTAMGVMGSIGAAVTVVGNFVLSLVANPLEELRLHAQDLRSWELAIELELAHGDAEAVRQSLARCATDEPPPVRVVGQGEPYSE